MRVALTGSKGLLGSSCVIAWKKAGHEVVALNSDITDAAGIVAEIEASKADAVVHTAALTDVGFCEREPEKARMVNVEGTKNVIEAARRIGARLLGISTVSVFDGMRGGYTESDAPHPMNVYNTTKYDAELLLGEYEKGTVVRLNLIGIHPEGSRGKNFVEFLVDAFKRDMDITVFDDVRINPLSHWTVADTLLSILMKGETLPVIHIGASDVLSKADVAALVAVHFPEYKGMMRRGSVDAIADGVVRPKEIWLDCSNAEAMLAKKFPTVADEVVLVLAAAGIGGTARA